MNKVRWGLVSTANINRRIIPAIRASKRGELVAVSSRSRARAEAYAAEWEIPRAYGSYEELLASDEIDAVYISLPNHLHAAWSIEALKAGKHVLCEKPFALSLDEVDRMIGAARQTGKVLAEAFMYRHHPQTEKVGELVREGRLGEITLMRGVFNFRLQEDDRKNVRLVPEWGGGALWDVGVYPLSLAQYVMGEAPEWVFGDQWLGPTGVDEVFAGQMHYSGGRMAQISCSMRTPFFTQAEIIGSKGRIVLNRPFVGIESESSLHFISEKGEVQQIEVPLQELYLGEIEDMHAAILEGKATAVSLGETRDHVRTTLALYESARYREPRTVT